MDETIRVWQMELLGPLAPHPDFVYRILKSAQDAAAQVFQGEAAMKSDHMHLVIYV